LIPGAVFKLTSKLGRIAYVGNVMTIVRYIRALCYLGDFGLALTPVQYTGVKREFISYCHKNGVRYVDEHIENLTIKQIEKNVTNKRIIADEEFVQIPIKIRKISEKQPVNLFQKEIKNIQNNANILYPFGVPKEHSIRAAPVPVAAVLAPVPVAAVPAPVPVAPVSMPVAPVSAPVPTVPQPKPSATDFVEPWIQSMKDHKFDASRYPTSANNWPLFIKHVEKIIKLSDIVSAELAKLAESSVLLMNPGMPSIGGQIMQSAVEDSLLNLQNALPKAANEIAAEQLIKLTKVQEILNESQK